MTEKEFKVLQPAFGQGCLEYYVSVPFPYVNVPFFFTSPHVQISCAYLMTTQHSYIYIYKIPTATHNKCT